MGFDHGAGGATGTAGAGGATTAPRLRLGIVGTGYLGATHAVCMSELGFDVLGLDVDDGKIAKLAAGEVPFYEPGLEPLLRRSLDSGRLRFTTSYAEVAAFADVHFLCVGTPQKDGEYAADLSAVDAAIDGLLPLLSRPCLLVGKSTVPAGTADRRVSSAAAEATPKTSRSGRMVSVMANPSRRNSGFQASSTVGASAATRAASRSAVPAGTVELPTSRQGRDSSGSRPSIAASTALRSAAYSPSFCGVPTQRKCTSAKAATSAYDVVNRSRPESRLLRSSGSRPGS